MSRNYTYQQHFLKNLSVVAELVGHSNIRKNDLVYDLGAGSGVISSVLARRAKEVVAVESEPQTLELLKKNLAKFENVEIVKSDILEVQPPERPYKIFANIPFDLSSKVIRKFAYESRTPKSIYLIVQKQFAWKLVPSDRHYNSELGAELWPWWSARIRKPLRRNDFTPPPGVDTVLLELKPLEEPLLKFEQQKAYRQFVRSAFDRQNFFAKLPRARVGIGEERKPSELTPQQWIGLFKSTIIKP